MAAGRYQATTDLVRQPQHRVVGGVDQSLQLPAIPGGRRLGWRVRVEAGSADRFGIAQRGGKSQPPAQEVPLPHEILTGGVLAELGGEPAGRQDTRQALAVVATVD